ncbi:hypothetical protein CIPAW_01G275500 [Carya illinoinensis]|uniref:Uncharacterized protein n=1 Tax=Carya illinoinensis TaxID=32201 RepID=A0A8T1RSI5_CARIL|nr:hypothetical protein CIPAW_01G275500 [Carya illinoinensis]
MPVNYLNAKPNFSFAILALGAAAQKRWASQATTKEYDSKISIGLRKGGEARQGAKDTGVVYMHHWARCPVITFMTSPDMNVILKGAVALSVIFLGASTTAALHWSVSPYVHKLRWQPVSDSFEVEMLSWLATYIPRTIKFADIRPPEPRTEYRQSLLETNRPFVTFKAKGQFYFSDAEHCHNKALLPRMTAKI